MQTIYEQTYTTPKCLAENELIFERLRKITTKARPHSASKVILEIAAGYGDPFTKFMAENVTQFIHGVDIEKDALSKNHWLAAGFQGSLSEFPEVLLQNFKYAAVVNLFGVYGTGWDTIQMIKQAQQVLYPGGDLLIVAYAAGRKDS